MSSFDNPPDIAPVGRDSLSPASPKAPTASTGFGLPVTDSTVRKLDLNEALIQHPQATYMARAGGSAMQGVGSGHGDVLIVDRALTARSGSTVIAVVDGELACRRLTLTNGKPRLEAVAAGGVCSTTASGDALEVWGVVTAVIKSLLA